MMMMMMMMMRDDDDDDDDEGVYWKAGRTDRNMSLLIEDCRLQIEDCEEIGAFTVSGLCVGSASILSAYP